MTTPPGELDNESLKKIRRVILFWLARRDYSRQELAQKLKAKPYPEAEIHSVLTEFMQSGYINETRFTENYIHWRRNKGYGPVRISMELQNRGIPLDVIAEHLDISDNAWLTQAQTVWRKHFKGKTPTDFKARAKQMRFLQYRGFTREQIEGVMGGEVCCGLD